MSTESKREIKTIFKGYTKMTSSLKKKLNKKGFVLSEGGKHWVLRSRDLPSFKIVFSKTPSDHRCGIKIACDVINKLS